MSERSRRSTAGRRPISDEYDNEDPWGSRRSSSSRASGASGSIKASRKSSSGKRTSSTPRGSAKKPKYLKNSQGQKSKAHNPYKDTDFHYGSDFDDVSNDDNEDPLSDASSELEEDREESDGFEIESDVEIDQLEPTVFEDVPEPYWMRTGEDAIPTLRIPPSSEDLLVSSELALKASGVYEIIRHFLPLLRLSPFTFEEMCAALQDEKQSNLLTEIHISLLKSLLRADEKENTMYAPNDLKDSINSIFFFTDFVTWPEGLRSYLISDPVTNSVPLKIYEEYPEYPLPPTEGGNSEWIEARVKMLTFLTDQFLATTTVREDISNERPTWPEDHCRVCHRTGDRIFCEQCGGSYHMHCHFPPLYEEPSEDWKCQICIKHEVTGVTDCGYDNEYRLTRHEPLGQDRLGNSYWFVCRRIFVEGLDGKVTYYSSKLQLRELIEALDSEEYEAELFANLNENLMMIKKHMETTEALTKAKKTRHSQSYIEAENELIEEAMAELELKRLEEMNRRRAKIEQRSSVPTQNGLEKDDPTGHKENGMDYSANNEDEPITNDSDDMKPFEDFVPRKTAQESQPDYKFFKLGDDGSHRTYINQYTANSHALTKAQATEERNKRTQMSHKFSLTDLSAFKWPGMSPDTRDQLEIALRACLFNLENNIPNIFMHNNWGKAREAWVKAVRESYLTRDFTRALTALVCFMKPCLLLNVWHEALGHTSLKKIVGQLKDDKKKTERRERRDKDLEDERMRPYMGFVKYTRGLKHQVVKQKGEEYRSHGQTGWLWVSNNRKFVPKSMNEVGLRGRNHKVAIYMHNTKTNKKGIVVMKGKDFDACKQEQDKRDLRKAMGLDEDSEPEEADTEDKKPESEPRKTLKLDPSVRIESQEQPSDLFKDVVNVEQQLSSSARPAYPKIGACAKFFDQLLEKKQGSVVKTETNGDASEGGGDASKSNGGSTSTVKNRLLYPEAPSFNILSEKKSILVLAKHDAKRLARKAGMAQCEGFNYSSKPNPQAWPYPCPRPTFRTAWLYRLATSESIQSVALHVRILWACLRWDDMQVRPVLINGKYEVTSESSTTTLEVLQTRTSGRFQEKTEYLIRKVISSLDAPKPVKEITPVRAGLRKRRREDVSEEFQSEPTEEWISEDQLDLAQIRAFKEKLDPRSQVSKIRPIRATTSSTNTPESSRASSPATNGKFVKTITQSPQIVYTVKPALGTPVGQRTLGVISNAQGLTQANRISVVTAAGVQKGEPIRVVIPTQRPVPGALNQTIGNSAIHYVVKGVQQPVSTIIRTASSTESFPVIKGTLVKMSDGKIVLKPIENQGTIGQLANAGTPVQIISSLGTTIPQSSSIVSQPTQNASRVTFSPLNMTPKLTPSPLFPTTSGSRINPTISTSLNPGDIVRLQDSKSSGPPPVRLTLNFISNKPLPFRNCTIQASTTILNNKKLLVLSGLAGHLPQSVQQQIKDTVFRHQGDQLAQGKTQSTKFEVQLTASINPNTGSLGSSPAPISSPISKENNVSIKSPPPAVVQQPVAIQIPKLEVVDPEPAPATLEPAPATHEPAPATHEPVLDTYEPAPDTHEEVLPAQTIPDPAPEPVEEVSMKEESEDPNSEVPEDDFPQGLMCVCQTEYDPTKHYVGCDNCSQWFHPECVGLTLEQVETMDGFECPPCTQVKPE